MILQALLGLQFDPSAREIRLHDPIVPESLGEITIRGLQLCDARVDFAVHRIGTATSLRVLRNDGAIRVSLVMDTGRIAFDTIT